MNRIIKWRIGATLTAAIIWSSHFVPNVLADPNASIRADFQQVVDGKISVAEVTAPERGFVAVWLPKNNKPFRGEVIGLVAVEPGKTVSLKIKLTKAVKTGQTLGVALHRDTGKVGEFDFSISAKTDPPFMNGRRPVIEVIGIID